MFNIGAGFGLIVIAITAQLIISKRLKNQKVSKIYSWVAWVGALLGGVGVTDQIGNAAGISAGGSAIASIIMLLFIAADLSDRRPDWLAFILICLTPTFMRLSAGTLGQIYDAILSVPDAILNGLGSFLGM